MMHDAQINTMRGTTGVESKTLTRRGPSRLGPGCGILIDIDKPQKVR